MENKKLLEIKKYILKKILFACFGRGGRVLISTKNWRPKSNTHTLLGWKTE